MTQQRASLTPPIVTLDRREFIKVAGFAVVAVQCLPATAYASATSLRGATHLPDELIIKSGPGAFHHMHYLRIAREQFNCFW